MIPIMLPKGTFLTPKIMLPNGTFLTPKINENVSVQPTVCYDYSDCRDKLRLGLCCINTVLRLQKPPIFCSRTCNRKNFTVESAQEKAIQNVKDISTMINWNVANNIHCLRLSSDIYPHFTDKEVDPYTIDFSIPHLKIAGDLANSVNQRILMHPGQYNQVGAKSLTVFEQTVTDLTHHATILDAMGIGKDGVLIVHGGGTYGDKESTTRRWIEQFDDLPRIVKNRLVLENCERQYNTRDCLYIANECKIPVVFDFHHYTCFSQIYPHVIQESFVDLAPEIIDTWHDKRVLMHISEQGCGRIGHHSDFIETLPDELFTVIRNNNVCIDLEIEAKKKEQAIFKLYKKYPLVF